MKKVLHLMMMMMMMMTSCGGNQQAKEEDSGAAVADSSKLITVKYSVEGMTCTGCENTVNYALGEIPGVTGVESSFREAFTLVTFDSTMVGTEDIEEAVNGKGYRYKGLFSEE